MAHREIVAEALVLMTEQLARLPVHKMNLRAGGANDHLMIVGQRLVAPIQPVLDELACRRTGENDRAIHTTMIVALGCAQLRYLKSGAGRTVLDVPNDPANLTRNAANSDCDGAAHRAHNQPDGTPVGRLEQMRCVLFWPFWPWAC